VRSLALFALLCGGCGGAAIIPLLDSGSPITSTPPHAIPLEVITRRNSTVPDPLPVRGSFVAFEQLEAALGHSVASATVPWAEQHMQQHPEGWQLEIELIAADARAHGREVTVRLDVRATLRTRTGNRYLAQTQTHCQRSLVAAPRDAAPALLDCTTRVGRQLGGWLGGINP
jgi:hypothetical protein